jgi:integrase
MASLAPPWEERRITLHSHQHFLNMALLAAQMPDPLVRRVTGRHTQEMTERYLHFALEDFIYVVKVQDKVFG